MGVPRQSRRPNARPAAPIRRQRHREMLFDDDPYGVPMLPRHTAWPAPPVQHRLAKLDVFKGEIGEKSDDFIFQVEEFATFHEWDLMEMCRWARTHLRGVALAYIRRTPIPPRDWTELKTLLTRRFQPSDLTAAYKAQWTRYRSWLRWPGRYWTQSLEMRWWLTSFSTAWIAMNYVSRCLLLGSSILKT